MSDFFPALVVLVLGTAIAVMQANRFPRSEGRLLLLSFATRIAAAFAQIWITRAVYGGGDIFGYTAFGDLLAATLRADFAQFAPELVKLFFHLFAVIPAAVPGVGSSTGSMAAVAGMLVFVTGGGVYTLCLTVTIGAYFGQVALYRAFREALGDEHKQRLLVAVLLIPSAVFWSSGLLKEAVAMIGLGFLMLGLERSILRRIEVKSFVMMSFGALLVVMLKAYILLGTVAALAAAIYARPGKRRGGLGKPVQLVLAVGIAAACYFVLVRAAPEYSVESLGEQAAFYQEMGQENQGGSSYSIGDPTNRSLSGQLVYAPFALFTAVFRPLIIESKNPLIFANALETSTLLFFCIRALARRGIRETWRFVTGNSMLMFCLAFVVAFGTGVGLVTTNLGSLSRYRMPLVPFLWALILTLDAKVPQAVATRVVSRLAPAHGMRARGRWPERRSARLP